MLRSPAFCSARSFPRLARTLATVHHSPDSLLLTHDGKSLHLSGPQLAKPLSLPYAWLRDSCQCPRCIHPSSKQKLARTGDFLSSAPRSISLQSGGLAVSWVGESEQEGAHESHYPLSFLQRYAEPTGHTLHASHFDNILARRPWDLSTLPAPLFIHYEEFLKDPLPGFVRVLRDGFMLLRGVPTEQTEYGHTAPSAVEPLAHMFGIARETMYGRLWDVVSKKKSTNIAFTNLKLDLHMDLMYLQHPPHIQFLHCIKTQVQGGSSVFVDALKAAHDLWHQGQEAFRLLASTPIPFHYENGGHHLHHSHTTIQLAPNQPGPTDIPPEITNINYCPPFQAPLPINTPLSVYSALAKFAQLLSRPETRLEQLLQPGDCAVFDNRRVLHARTAFWDERAKEGDEQETNRWLKGCYVERDEVLNRARGMLASREKGAENELQYIPIEKFQVWSSGLTLRRLEIAYAAHDVLPKVNIAGVAAAAPTKSAVLGGSKNYAIINRQAFLMSPVPKNIVSLFHDSIKAKPFRPRLGCIDLLKPWYLAGECAS